MKRMKRFCCIILAAVLLFPGAAFFGFAADAGEENAAEVRFSTDYFEIGQETKVIVDGCDAENLTYQWYVGGARVLHDEASYTPAEYELESFIKVEVYSGGDKLGEAERYFSRLPVCYIETGRNAILKDSYIDAQMKIQGNKQYSKASLLYDGKIQIKGRGNTTWTAPKKPYKIKLDSKANLFDMGKNKHWVLLANYFDTSSLRNKLSYDMSGAMGMDYQQSVWVNVVLDGECRGVYQLCEHVRVGSTRTNIFDWEGAAEDAAGAIAKANGLSKAEKSELEDSMVENFSWVTSDVVTLGEKTFTVSEYYTVPNINGGFLYEVDPKTEVSNFRTAQGRIVSVNSPEYLNTNSAMFAAAQEYFQAVEDAVYASDFCTVYQGETVRYTDLIDLDSFVIGWLVNDIFTNVDFGRKSTYYYKDVDGKLFYGPVWDMDYTADANTASSAHYYQFRTIKDEGRRFMFEMTRDPVFVARAHELYWSLRYGYLEEMLKEGGTIDADAAYLKEALKNNDRIWGHTYTADENTAVMKDWLKLRTIWLDKQFATNESLYRAMHSADYSAELFPLEQDEPVALTVSQLPQKLDYAVGEALELTGLTLTVTLRSGETQTVEPDCYYVSMPRKGRAENTFEGIAATQGEKTVTLCYRNVRASFPIRVYSDTVATAVQLISAIPSPVTASDYGAISAARQYVDALSPQEQAQITNLDALTEAQTAFDAIIEASRQNNDYVLNAYLDGNICYGGSNVIVVEAIHNPSTRAIVFLNPNGGTSTYSASAEGVCVINDGKVQTWTIYCSPKYAYVDVWAKGASTNTLRLNLNTAENETTLFKAAVVPSVATPAIEGKRYVYPAFAEATATTSSTVDSVRALCGDIVTEGTVVSSADAKVWSFSVPLTCGDNEISFRYTCNGREYAYHKTDHCYLREQPPAKPVGLRVASLPDKTAYFCGDALDTTGLVIEELYNDETALVIPQGYTVSPLTLTEAGTQTITVAYSGFTCTFPVSVQAIEPAELSVVSKPDKTVYTLGEAPDLTGLQLKLTMNNGSSQIITDGFTCETASFVNQGLQLVNVTYGGLNCSFEVTVHGKVRYVTASNKELNYKQTDDLSVKVKVDPGVKYTVTFSSSDPTVVTVDEYGSVRGFKRGAATVTVTVRDEYGNKAQDTCTVTVGYTAWQWFIILLLFGWLWY